MVCNDSKPLLRSALLKRRRLIGPEQPAKAGSAAADQFFAAIDRLPQAIWGAGATVAGYWPLQGEIDPRPLMALMAEAGISLALPVTVGADEALIFRRFRLGDPLERGPFGVHQPGMQHEELRPCLALVPLVGFDRRGGRIGFGGGFYDRTLARLGASGNSCFTCGLAYAWQEVSHVPIEAHDQILDAVATDDDMIVMLPDAAKGRGASCG